MKGAFQGDYRAWHEVSRSFHPDSGSSYSPARLEATSLHPSLVQLLIFCLLRLTEGHIKMLIAVLDCVIDVSVEITEEEK